MALQISLTAPQGITLSTAYTRINNIRYGHTDCIISVDTWADQAARLANLAIIGSQSYSMTYDPTGTSLTAAYDYLKTLPEFSGAVSV